MAWRDLFKRQKQFNVSLGTIAAIPMEFLRNKDKRGPFQFLYDEEVWNKWIPPFKPRPLNSDESGLFRLMVVFYQINIYLRLISKKFGKDVERLSREHLLIQLEHIPELYDVAKPLSGFFEILPDTQKALSRMSEKEKGGIPFETFFAARLISTIPGSPGYISVTDRHHVDKSENYKAALERDKLDCILGTCLIIGKHEAYNWFIPLVDMLSLEKEVQSELQATNETTKPKTIQSVTWRKQPGQFERHLQRRFKNPLFIPARQEITAEELIEARWRDDWVREVFSNMLHSFLEEIKNIDQLISLEKFKGILFNIRKLLFYSSGIGIDPSIKESLKHAYKKAIDQIIASNGKAAALEDEQEFESLKTHLNPFLAQAYSADSPIQYAVEFYQGMLCEDIEIICEAVELMPFDGSKTKIFDLLQSVISTSKLDAMSASAYQQKVDTAKDRWQAISKRKVEAATAARTELLKSAEEGNIKSQVELAIAYQIGRSFPQDHVQAAKWYLKAAERGNPIAQYNLGLLYHGGLGVMQNLGEATKWYHKAAEQDYADAQYNLGWAYQHGEGIAQNLAEAMSWYVKAAEQGYAKAQCNLGGMFFNGEGMTQDFAEARKWYLMAAEQDDVQAQFNLGMMYIKSSGVPQDYIEAAKWFLKAAEQGEINAQFNLARMYEYGYGISQDISKAFKWYLKAAEQGETHAQGKLGLLYEHGNGVAQNFEEAFKWYKRAAEQGDVHAQCNLGLLYEDGNGVAQNLEEAASWYLKSAKQSYSIAQFLLALSYEFGTGVTQDYNEAIKWLSLSAEQGHAPAQARMGEFYDQGRGVAQDHIQAYMWFSLACAGLEGEQQEEAATARDEVLKKMTPQQIADAQLLAQEWKPKHAN